MAFEGRDIPIVQLRPLRDRRISKTEYARISASIRALGLIEPLVVFPEKKHYVILNGCQRYRILLEMGVEVVPCILWKEKEAFTANRMVNRLSPMQETRMLRKSLEELDESTIARALGLTSITHRLKASLLKQLHPRIAAAFDGGALTKACAQEFTYVKPKRQVEIINAMESYNDYSSTFARTMILRTPPDQRSKRRGSTRSPWSRNERNKSDLLKKLKEAEEKHDFYAGLYRQYSINLLKLVIFARSLISNERIAAYVQEKHPETLAMFREIVSYAEG